MPFLRMTLLFLLLLAAVLFGFSNPQWVDLRLWPTPYTGKAPLSALIIGAVLISYFIGVLSRWLPMITLRRRLRRAEADLAATQNQLRLANQQLAISQTPPIAPPPSSAYPSGPLPPRG